MLNSTTEYWWRIRNYSPPDFNIWWNEEKNNLSWNKYSFNLCLFCNNNFNIWWNPDKFNWNRCDIFLKKYCSEHKNIWEKDYFIHKLKN